MKKILLFILLICNLVPATILHAQTIEVPEDFSTIQAAIDAAQSGDTVSVAPGVYTGSIQLAEGVQLHGEETARTILRSSGAEPVIQMSGLNNIVIRNFTFADSETGISIANSTNVDINNNVFDVGGNGTGIVITSLGSSVNIENNTFFGSETAIDGFSEASTIRNNIFAFNGNALSGDTNQDNVSFNCFSGDAIGADATTGDPDFVDIDARDFHLRTDSPCIDAGTGTDALDNTEADAGAYGGQLADTRPFPVAQPQATAVATNTPSVFNLEINWPANRDYRVDGYRLYYDSDQSGEPYEGTDAQDAGGQPVSSPIDVGNVTGFTLHNLSAVADTPDTPVLQSASPSNQTVVLRWSGVANADGYRIYYGIASLDENTVDVGNVNSHQIQGLENGTVYRLAVTAISQPRYHLAVTAVDNEASEPNESEFSEARSVAVGEEQESPLSNEMTAIPETVEPYPDLPDQGDISCFIATAAYGHYSKPQVQVLRDFRDAYLIKYSAGRAFVEWYYAWSPAAAAFISEHPLLKTITAWALLPLVGIAYFLVYSTPLMQLGLLLLCCLPALWIVSRKFNFRTIKP
ncbi:MAG TPA: CFI-box-CTERM domain-containing protein [Gammaproteobacteria bacterium]|jgi:hypothetical protein